MIRKLSDFSGEIIDFHNKGIQKGEYVGFECLDELYTKKKGSMTFILAAPHSGKTEFTLELLLNLSLIHGERHLIFTPETGDFRDIAKELVSKYHKKPFFKSDVYGCTEAEIYQAINFLDDKFFIIDTDENNFTFEEMMQGCRDFEKKYAIKVDNILFDPYNEVKHDMKEYGTRQDLYIEDITGKLRRFAKKEDKHIFVCMHPQKQEKITVDGVTFYPPPHSRQAAGGESFFRKAMSFLILWRPPKELVDPETGLKYPENELHVFISKAKPKGSGKLGMCKLYFNWRANRYFEYADGKEYYAFDLKTKKTKGNETGRMDSGVIKNIFGKEFIEEAGF